MITHFFSWQKFPDGMWPHFAAEFRDNGAGALVLTHHWGKRLLDEPDFSERLTRFLRTSGLILVGAHAPFGPDWDLYSADSAHVIGHRELLRRCAGFGIRSYTVHVGEFPSGCTRNDSKDHARRTLEQLLPCAAELGVVVAVENAEHSGGSVSALLELRRTFPGAEMGFCYDSGHANLNGGGTAVLEALQKDVVVCHLHDNDGTADWHWEPGRGNLPWNDLCVRLGHAPRLESVQNEVNALDCGVSLRRLCGIFTRLNHTIKTGDVQ